MLTLDRPTIPTLGRAALHGLVGDVVDTIDPYTEAHPTALAASFLTMFGNAVGAGPHATADGAEHPARINVILVGDTSRARKGTATRQIRRVLEGADPAWASDRTYSGITTGEGLISAGAASRDDPRMMVIEEEFARVITSAGRDGSTLSPVVRQLFDSGDARVMTRKDPLEVRDVHVSILGHITIEELRRKATEDDKTNGLLNRFPMFVVSRSKLLPSSLPLPDPEIKRIQRMTRTALQNGRRIRVLHRTPEAEQFWAELYARMDESEDGGLLGAITARAEAHVLRFSVAYALTDGSNMIDVPHLEAAWALWEYAAASASMIFGKGDHREQRLLLALGAARDAGLDRSQIRDLFDRHISKSDLDDLLARLERRGQIRIETKKTRGRPREVVHLAPKALDALKGVPA